MLRRTTQPSSDITDPRAGAGRGPGVRSRMRAGRLVRRVGVGRTLPEGEGRPGYKSVAVKYAATIVTARATSSLVANHRCRSVPGPLCGCSRLSNMISSYSQPRLSAVFVPTVSVRAGARVTDRAAGHGFDQPRNGAAGVKKRGRLRSSTGRRRARLSGRRSGTGGSRKTPSGVIQDFHSCGTNFIIYCFYQVIGGEGVRPRGVSHCLAP